MTIRIAGMITDFELIKDTPYVTQQICQNKQQLAKFLQLYSIIYILSA